jgi:replicative DNA helicase
MHNKDIEFAIIGSMIRDSGCLSIGLDNIPSADILNFGFTKDILKALQSMSMSNTPIDAITVKNWLKLNNCWIDNLNDSWVEILQYESDINTFEAHIELFIEQHKLKVLESVCKQVLQSSLEGNKTSNEMIVEAQDRFNNVIHHDKGMKITNADVVMQKIKTDMEDSAKGIVKDLGIPNGFGDTAFDKQFTYNEGDLIVLAGRPGMGKSAMLIQLIKNLAVDNNIKTGLISLEMTQKENFYRLLANILNKDSYEVKKGGFSPQSKSSIIDCIDKYKEMPLYMNDNYDIDYHSLRAKVIYFAKVYQCKVVFIDHLGLINLSKLKKDMRLSTNEAVGEVTRMLKILSSELKISIVLLSQLSREVEKSGRNKPKLSDLRDSGRIEEDATKVFFLYRPEYYDVSAVDSMGRSLIGTTELIYAKNRGGSTGSWIFNSCMKTHRYFMNDELTYNPATEKVNKFQRN